MSEPKTKKTEASVGDFIAAIEDAEKQKDARVLLRMMQRTTGEKPKMWGTSIVALRVARREGTDEAASLANALGGLTLLRP
jgi:hypothetical protein